MTQAEPMTAERLWSNTVEYLGKVLPGDTDMKTFNKIAQKVYKQMKFLVKDSSGTRPAEPTNKGE